MLSSHQPLKSMCIKHTNPAPQVQLSFTGLFDTISRTIKLDSQISGHNAQPMLPNQCSKARRGRVLGDRPPAAPVAPVHLRARELINIQRHPSAYQTSLQYMRKSFNRIYQEILHYSRNCPRWELLRSARGGALRATSRRPRLKEGAPSLDNVLRFKPHGRTSTDLWPL